jgi:endonuclease/exonuclease/phosphatase family metal-dependent hydrolase
MTQITLMKKIQFQVQCKVSGRRLSGALFVLCVASVLLLTFSNALAADKPADKPATLRVLCYNIHYGQGMDGKYDVARLAEVIKKLKPDLVALQEIDVGVKRSGREHQIRRLGELTGMASRYGPTQHYQGGLYGNGVLSKLPILDVVIQPLPYTEATEKLVTYPRGCIALTVRGPDGKPLRFISTHFQHNVAVDRLAEAKAINKLFAGKDDTTRTILAGDMNATPDSDPMKELHKKWENAMNDPAAPSAPSRNPRSRIDYILHRSAEQFRVRKTEVVDEQMASDHRPVFAVFELLGR